MTKVTISDELFLTFFQLLFDHLGIIWGSSGGHPRVIRGSSWVIFLTFFQLFSDHPWTPRAAPQGGPVTTITVTPGGGGRGGGGGCDRGQRPGVKKTAPYFPSFRDS